MPNISTHHSDVSVRSQISIALLVAGTFFMENLDGTVIATALPAIARSFLVKPADLNIGMSAYLVTLGAFIPASGWLSERFGARRVFAAAIAIFTLASALCGIADGTGMFVAMRILQGIGGAMMVPVGRLIVLRATPKARIISAIATLTWPALVAPILGPPLGGFIVEYASWRWIFYLNLPLGVTAFIAAFLLIPGEDARRSGPFDMIGFLLSGAGVALIVTMLESVGREDVDWGIVAASGGCGLALVIAAIVHFRRAEYPLLDFGALTVPTFAVSIWGGSLFRMAIGAVPFLLPLMFQAGFGYDAFHAGLLMVAVFAGNLGIKPATSGILRRFGFRQVMVVNGLCNALALVLCALLSPRTPVSAVLALLAVGGMCRSMQFTAFGTIAFADVPSARMIAANTLFSTAMQLTMGLGVTLGALALRVGEITGGHGEAAYRIAFAIIGGVALLGTIDSLRLPEGAGDHLARRTTD